MMYHTIIMVMEVLIVLNHDVFFLVKWEGEGEGNSSV